MSEILEIVSNLDEEKAVSYIELFCEARTNAYKDTNAKEIIVSTIKDLKDILDVDKNRKELRSIIKETIKDLKRDCRLTSIFKDGAMRCEICNDEIDGKTICSCGYDFGSFTETILGEIDPEDLEAFFEYQAKKDGIKK